MWLRQLEGKSARFCGIAYGHAPEFGCEPAPRRPGPKTNLECGFDSATYLARVLPEGACGPLRANLEGRQCLGGRCGAPSGLRGARPGRCKTGMPFDFNRLVREGYVAQPNSPKCSDVEAGFMPPQDGGVNPPLRRKPKKAQEER